MKRMICILLGWICFHIFSATLFEAFVCGLGFVNVLWRGPKWTVSHSVSGNWIKYWVTATVLQVIYFMACFFLFLSPRLLLSPKCLLLSPPYFFISLQILVTDHSISSPTHLDTRRSLRSPLCSPYRCHCPILWPISKAFKVTRCWQLRAPTSSTRRMRSSRTPMSSMSTWHMSCPISCHSCRWVLDDCFICWWAWTQCFCC